MTAPINGNPALMVATQAEEELKRLRRERASLVTGLRRNARDIAQQELIVAVAGVETVDVGSEGV